MISWLGLACVLLASVPHSVSAFPPGGSSHGGDSKPLGSHLGQMYLASLAAKPLRTKALTAGCVEMCGDALAQWTERRSLPSNAEPSPSGHHNALIANSPGHRISRLSPFPKWLDFRRMLGCFLDGTFITGPFLHYSYGWLEAVLPSHVAGGGSMWAAVAAVAIDELVIDPIDVLIYLSFTSIIEREPVVARVREKYWPTLLGGLGVSLMLCPVQFVSFRYLPVSTRVLVVNFCDLAWMAAVSFTSHKSWSKPLAGVEMPNQVL